jgi:hypothetical protein
VTGAQPWAGWQTKGAEVVAAFEDGTAAVFINRVGKGAIASFATDAATAARDFPEVVRDVLDKAMAVAGGRRAVDIVGATENVDLAACVIPGGVRAAVVNHAAGPVEVVIVPLAVAAGTGQTAAQTGDRTGVWTDLATGASRPGRPGDGGLAVSVPALGYVCWEYKTGDSYK